MFTIILTVTTNFFLLRATRRQSLSEIGFGRIDTCTKLDKLGEVKIILIYLTGWLMEIGNKSFWDLYRLKLSWQASTDLGQMSCSFFQTWKKTRIEPKNAKSQHNSCLRHHSIDFVTDFTQNLKKNYTSIACTLVCFSISVFLLLQFYGCCGPTWLISLISW